MIFDKNVPLMISQLKVTFYQSVFYRLADSDFIIFK